MCRCMWLLSYCDLYERNYAWRKTFVHSFFSVLRQLSHRKAASTLPLRAGSQQLLVKYGDLYAWLSSGITYVAGRLGTIFFPVLGGLFHRKAALTFLLRADLQQWSVNYGDLYVGFFKRKSFQRSLRLQALHQLMFTNETRCLL